MGCDIHLYVEKLQDGKWVAADRWTKDKYAEEGEDRLTVEYENRYYTGRNYNLFAILADVRNGRGFAGVKTGEGFNPICEPKGLPEDCSPEVERESDSWGSDGHSHSWLTVAELMAYDWTQVSCLQGWVDAVNFEEFDRWRRDQGEGPEEYCGGVSGSATRHVSNDDMRAMIKGKAEGIYGSAYQAAIAAAAPGCYTLIEWTIPYYKCASKFLSEVIPRLWLLGQPSEVRIVFWFDN